MDYLLRAFQFSDEDGCMALFDENCPDYFAPNERADYKEYLQQQGAEYCVYEHDGHIISAFGLHLNHGNHSTCINWILAAKAFHHSGMGRIMMQEAIARSKEFQIIHISASQHSAPFFERFGATKKSFIENGWGPGMHRIEMKISLLPSYSAAASNALV